MSDLFHSTSSPYLALVPAAMLPNRGGGPGLTGLHHVRM